MYQKQFIFSLVISLVLAVPQFSSDKEIKADLEVAVHDSAVLADELNAMLSHFDDDEDEVTFDNLTEDLEKALKVTEQLANAAEKQGFKVGLEKSVKSKILKTETSDLEQLDIDFDVLLDETDDDENLGGIDELTNDLAESLKVTEAISKSVLKQKTGKGNVNQILKNTNIKQKQLDFNLENIFNNENDKKSLTEEIDENSGVLRMGKGFSENDFRGGSETCTQEEPTTKANYCVPRFNNKNVPTKFHSHEPHEEKYCYTKNKTVCTNNDEAVEKIVCTYVYQQGSHDISVANLRVSLSTHSEKFTIKKCEVIEISEYGVPAKEVCADTFVTEHFSIPAVDERFLDQVVLAYPEPTQVCFPWPGYLVPRVACSQETVEHCVITSHLRDKQIKVDSDEVVLDVGSDCHHVDLHLSQELCTKHNKVTTPAPRRKYQG